MPVAHAPQHFVRGQQLVEAGRLTDAGAAYREALANDPAFLPAAFALGRLLDVQGNAGAAHAMLSRALALASGDSVATALVAPALAAVLATVVPRDYDPELYRDLAACLDAPQVDAQPLAAPIARLLLLKYPDEADAVVPLGRDPLWLALLTRCINVDPAMEARLAAVRAELLSRHADAATIPHAHVRPICALALQAFAGEYVWPVSPQEATRLTEPLHPLLAALYRPLASLAPDPSLRKLKKDRLSGLLVKRTLDDLIREHELAATMPALTDSSENAVSDAVRAQYEDHPYPRWRAPPTPRRQALCAMLAELPGIDAARLPSPPRDVLIAGCGTGYEAIGIARADPDATITAIDLSRASLAYGRRMADEMAVAGITSGQADILAVSDLGMRFDVIYATGVLHHMDCPADGLASLVAVLKPGGAIRLGLYSERARGPIVAARALIAERGWPATDDGIRAFRAHILALPEGDPLAVIRTSPDFYSLSGCRDLVFHIQEHRHSLPEIGEMMAAAGLRVAGIDAPAGALAAFAAMHGAGADILDLARWDALEVADPMTFAGMYLVWGQKIG